MVLLHACQIVRQGFDLHVQVSLGHVHLSQQRLQPGDVGLDRLTHPQLVLVPVKVKDTENNGLVLMNKIQTIL